MKDLQNVTARKEQNNCPTLVVAIKVGIISEQQKQRLLKYIGSHLLFAQYDNYGHLVIYVRTLRGFSLLETLSSYEIFLEEFNPELSLIQGFIPRQKGGKV